MRNQLSIMNLSVDPSATADGTDPTQERRLNLIDELR
jgi:hypothetical protein